MKFSLNFTQCCSKDWENCENIGSPKTEYFCSHCSQKVNANGSSRKTLNFQEFKTAKNEAENKVDLCSEKLNQFEKDDFGLTKDEIKFTKEFQDATQNFRFEFEKLRKINAWGSKVFKKELAAERKLKIKKGEAKYFNLKDLGA
jgi:hypothetical protein